MPKQDERMSITVKLPREQVTKLGILQKALEEKMNKKMTMSELFEKIVADFLEQ